MALIVEDGTGVAGAESYQSVADADAYHARWGNTSWAGLSTASKEANLRKATRYIDLTYGTRWIGVRATSTQGLDWPQRGAETDDGEAIESDELPEALGFATNEAALRAETEDLMPDVEIAASAGLKAERIKIGPLEIDNEFAGSQAITKRYPIIERLLLTAGLIRGTGAERG